MATDAFINISVSAAGLCDALDRTTVAILKMKWDYSKQLPRKQKKALRQYIKNHEKFTAV